MILFWDHSNKSDACDLQRAVQEHNGKDIVNLKYNYYDMIRVRVTDWVQFKVMVMATNVHSHNVPR